jgi:hypothetical protein
MEIHYHQYFQIISLLAAIAFYRGLIHFKLAAFIPLLLIVCIIEFLGVNNEYFGWKSNYFIYNYYLLLSPPFYFIVFYQMFRLKGKSRYILVGISILIEILVLLNYFFFQGSSRFNNQSMVFLSIMYIFITCLIILKINLLDEDERVQSKANEIYFIILSSTLLFNLGSLIVMGLQTFISANKIEMRGVTLYRFIMPKLNVIVYGAYAYAFYLCHKLNRKSP